VRNDTGVFEGGEISIFYDPMIAKLVTHAPTRLEAIEAQARALDAFAIDGIRHNIPFLATMMAQERWRSGRLSTGYIAEEFPEGFAPAAPRGALPGALPLVAARHRPHAEPAQARDLRPDAGLAHGHLRGRARRDAGGCGVRGRTVSGALNAVSVSFDDDGTRGRGRVRLAAGPTGLARAVDGERIAVQVRPIQNGVTLAHAGTHAGQPRGSTHAVKPNWPR
jgi:propionyl-CoA carboxylase alpha chain